MVEKLKVTPSPHIKGSITTTKIMLAVILSLLPTTVMSFIIFGSRALMICGVSIISCVAFEFLYGKLLRKSNTIPDLSAVVTGLILALNLPVSIPYPIIIIGAFFAVVVIKCLFGGIGQNFVNPAIGARVFMLLSFSGAMTNYTLPHNDFFIATSTPLSDLAAGNADKIPEYTELFLGNRAGSLGEVCIAAILVGAIFLVVTKVISPVTPIAFLGSMAVFALLLGEDPIMHLLLGGAVFGAVFMATDYTTSPVTKSGKIIFGIGCGFLTMIIRVYGSLPEGVSYAILLMNILVPLIERVTIRVPFGGVKK